MPVFNRGRKPIWSMNSVNSAQVCMFFFVEIMVFMRDAMRGEVKFFPFYVCDFREERWGKCGNSVPISWKRFLRRPKKRLRFMGVSIWNVQDFG